jgi:lipopolysaccharide export system protein LptA
MQPSLLLSSALLALMVAAPAIAQAQEGTSRLTGLRMSGSEPIQIESDKLEVLDNESRAVFTGNVNVTQGPTLLKAGRMVVHYAGQGANPTDGNSQIERLEVEDKVYIKSQNQVATGDKGMFDMASEVLTLSGKEVVLSEGTNVLVGCKLTVQMKTGRAQVDGCASGGGSGRVIMSITPGSQNN